MGNKNISICWPHSVVFFCLLLLTPSLCQDDSDSDDDGDSTSAVYIVTLRQAPSHFQDELKSVGKGFRHAPPGTRRTRTRLQKPRPANVTKTGRGHGSYIIRFHDLLLKRVFKGEKYLKLYSYHYLINGFSVLVTPQQAEKLSRRREVSNVVLDYSVRTATTHTPQFLDLPKGAWFQTDGHGTHTASSSGCFFNSQRKDIINHTTKKGA